MNPGRRWPVTLGQGPVRLRPMRRRDRAAWDEVRRRNWEWLRPWEPTMPPGLTSEVMTFPELVGSFNRQAREGRALPFLVDWAPPGQRPRLIGQVSMLGIQLGSARWGQVGYWIDRDFAGRGITPLAVAMVCDHAWFALGLHRVEIVIRPENAASLRVVQKLGFREEGPRPAYLHIDGAWRDHRVFALHAEEVGPGLVARCPAVRW